jgi:hypothetical protein
MLGKHVGFSIQDEQFAEADIISPVLHLRPTSGYQVDMIFTNGIKKKGHQLAHIYLNINPIYFWPLHSKF